MNENAVLRAVVLTGFAMTVTVTVATAQQGPETPLTLNAAVEFALRNHPAIREARAGSVAASADVGVARAAYLPRLDFLWQVNRATRNNVFGLLLPQPVIPAVSGPVLGTETLNGVWSNAGGLLMSWEAVDFGRRGASVDLARAESGFADAQRTVTNIDGTAMNGVLSMRGTVTEGIYRAAIGRVAVASGTPVGREMGRSTSIVIFGTGERAFAAADLIASPDQLQRLLKALRARDFTVTAIRNHAVAEHPELLFVRVWKEGSALELAKALRFALDVEVGAVKLGPDQR